MLETLILSLLLAHAQPGSTVLLVVRRKDSLGETLHNIQVVSARIRSVYSYSRFIS